MKRKYLDMIMVLVLLIGIVIFSYPFINRQISDFLDQQMIAKYQKEASKRNEQEVAEMMAKQEALNQKLASEKTAPGLTAYTEALAKTPKEADKSYYENHMIAVLKIPAINVDLPIFDQTTDLFLRKGVSLLEGSSYPIGGENTHAVLSSHRGLPEATLFDQLPDLEIKDKFYIEINQETHAYQVDQIKVILPTETDDLLVEDGQDYVTLLTCTPYMINTHRLLVRGHRIPYTAESKTELKEQAHSKNKRWIIWIIVICCIISLIIFMIIYQKKRNSTDNRVK
ncbi:class C sortase [Enterococcus sp. DIV0876]|uniref:class C sortase n=1 Tax=Enterococcus sp. DIV0876 TaxID=2774633 RepID=UPI003D2FB355